MTERDLIGDLRLTRERFATLVAEIRPELHRYCARMTGSIADGEDVVQDTLARAYYALEELDEVQPLRAWLFRIAHNRAVDLNRRYAVGGAGDEPVCKAHDNRAVLARGRDEAVRGHDVLQVRHDELEADRGAVLADVEDRLALRVRLDGRHLLLPHEVRDEVLVLVTHRGRGQGQRRGECHSRGPNPTCVHEPSLRSRSPAVQTAPLIYRYTQTAHNAPT